MEKPALRRGKLASKDAELVAGTEGAGEVAGICVASQGFAIGLKQTDGFFRRFIQQLKAEVAQACGKELGKVRGAGLGARVKHRVAAADIGSDGMRFSDAVSDGDSVMVAWTATGEMVFASGQKSGEDAVFHMKHWDVLVKG